MQILVSLKQCILESVNVLSPSKISLGNGYVKYVICLIKCQSLRLDVYRGNVQLIPAKNFLLFKDIRAIQ